MSQKSFAKISIRIIAIYIATYGIMYIPSIATLFEFDKIDDVKTIVMVVFSIITPLILSILLWLSSDKLAIWVIGNQNNVKPINADVTQLQTIALCTVGFIIIVTALPNFAGEIIRIYYSVPIIEGERILNTYHLSYLVTSSLKIILGILLVSGVRFWVHLLHKIKRLGLYEKKL
ncbi:hypothetical protein CRYPA_923 [uncultured Candidatus Thioglobus sp.]|nr:hypothetical protein CRYPA_923 [uncultured Candidatus Thioglobus sp.]